MTDTRSALDAQGCTSKSVDDQKSPKVNDNARAAFERHFQLSQRQAKRDNLGDYVDPLTRARWEGYQVGRNDALEDAAQVCWKMQARPEFEPEIQDRMLKVAENSIRALKSEALSKAPVNDRCAHGMHICGLCEFPPPKPRVP